jgi:hypothetical protein
MWEITDTDGNRVAGPFDDEDELHPGPRRAPRPPGDAMTPENTQEAVDREARHAWLNERYDRGDRYEVQGEDRRDIQNEGDQR